jgi:hypothetical protein
MEPIMVWGYAFTAFVIGLAFLCINMEEAYQATCAECDASAEFIAWRQRNPGVYIGLSEEGRSLLNEWIDSLDWFMKTHLFVDLREKRECLIELLNDLPPNTPKSFPILERPQALVSFFIEPYSLS